MEVCPGNHHRLPVHEHDILSLRSQQQSFDQPFLYGGKHLYVHVAPAPDQVSVVYYNEWICQHFSRQINDFTGFIKILCRQNNSLYGSTVMGIDPGPRDNLDKCRTEIND